MGTHRRENSGAPRSDTDRHDGDRVGHRNGGRGARSVGIHVVRGRLTHREQRLFEEAVMLLLLGSAHRHLTAHKERDHDS